MKKFMFLFTIGPVQSYISQARKSKDLYAGSRILSHLIDFAMKVTPGEPEFIFPPKDSTASKPNRFIAILSVKDEEEVKAVGKNIEEAVREKYRKIAIDLFNRKVGVQTHLQTTFEKQINEHLQINWVAIEYDESNYNEQFRKIESYLGALKNIKMFNQLDEEPGRKCSLCGERNVIFWRSKDSKKLKYPKETIKLEDDLIAVNEGLCSVCFTKRYYEAKEFPATAEVALSESVLIIKETGGKEKVNEYLNFLGNDMDYQLFYEESLTSRYFERQGLDNKKIDQVTKLYKSIKNIKPEGIKLTPYYAIVMFDGDSMGEWLSGKKVKTTSSLKQYHKKLSNYLVDFAVAAGEVLKEEKGRIIYAGGEDFLGLVNLNHLFPVLKNLRVLFKNKVSDAITEYKRDIKDELSFSAGVVIAHYKMPFQEVLTQARAAEKAAKNETGKNSVSFTTLKHSGEVNRAVVKWGNEENAVQSIEELLNISIILEEGAFSSSFTRTLSEELSVLMDANGNIELPRIAIIKTELKRLLKRSCLIKDKDNAVNGFYKSLEFFLGTNNANNFLSILSMINFLNKHLNGGIA